MGRILFWKGKRLSVVPLVCVLLASFLATVALVNGWYCNQLYSGVQAQDHVYIALDAVESVDLDMTGSITPIVFYPQVYVYNGEMRIGNGDPSPAIMTFDVHVARTDSNTNVGLLFAAVALKITNESNGYYSYPNSTYVVLAPGMDATIQLTWWSEITPGNWTVGAEAYPITSNANDTNRANNYVADGTVQAINAIKGDFNGDGLITIYDGIIFMNAYGRKGSPGWIPQDLMPDGVIDMFDVNIMKLLTGEAEVTWELKISTSQANYTVEVFSDYIVYSDYSFNESLKQLNFNVTSSIDAFCNITIPKGLMSGTFALYLDDARTPFIRTENDTHYFVYFNSTELSHKVKLRELLSDVCVTNVSPSKTVAGQGYTIYIMVAVENQGDFTETFNVTAYYNQTAIMIEQWPDGANSQVFWSMGDVNRDGYIDNWDLYKIEHAFNSRPGDSRWNPDVDINSDGVVNMIDIATCAKNYGKDIWVSLGLPKLIENQRAVTLSSGNSAIVTFRWNTTDVAKGNYTISAYAWPVPNETDTADNTFIDGMIYVGIPGDINGDGIVDIYDAIILARAYNSKLYDPVWNANADINSDANVDIYDALMLAGNFGKGDP